MELEITQKAIVMTGASRWREARRTRHAIPKIAVPFQHTMSSSGTSSAEGTNFQPRPIQRQARTSKTVTAKTPCTNLGLASTMRGSLPSAQNGLSITKKDPCPAAEALSEWS